MPQSTDLHGLLTNTIVLRQLLPYLPVHALLNLTSTAKSVRDIVLCEPEAFRHLNLTGVKNAIVKDSGPLDRGGINQRSQRMDEALTQDEFISGPLRGIFASFARQSVLQHVQTFILDGLGVTAELVDEIINQDRFNVRILSIRGCQINEGKLMQVLKYAVRPSRAEGMPRLRALYFFGPKGTLPLEHPTSAVYDQQTPSGVLTGVTQSEGAQLGTVWNKQSRDALDASLSRTQDKWYRPCGRMIQMRDNLAHAWAETLQDCEGIIAFDAVQCRGPRHDSGQLLLGDQEKLTQTHLPAAIANVALGAGCQMCHTMPETPAVFGVAASPRLPLLEPLPLHSSTVREAQRPHLTDPTSSSYPPLFVRCEKCLRARWCERCLKWWCEDCYTQETAGRRIDEVSTPIPLKVHPDMNLCIESCLVGEMMSGAGSNGMWA